MQPDILGLYLHLPFCDAKCPYCAFYSLPGIDPDQIDRFLTALIHEGLRRRETLPDGYRPSTVYIGGGTPSLLSVAQLERLCGFIRSGFAPPLGAEWTVECNPGSIDRDKLHVLKAAGVNRISLGAQSFDDHVLHRLGRRHDTAAIYKAVDLIREAGIANFNLDLIACVPGVGEHRWQGILERALALQPAHVSVYSLTLEEGHSLPHDGHYERNAALSNRRELRILKRTAAQLCRAGYRRYEISNYARRGRRCRHHLDFWRGADYLGLGPGAVSRLGAVERCNTPDLAGYLDALRHGGDAPHDTTVLAPPACVAERLAIGLRQSEGLALRPLLKRFGMPYGSRDWPEPVLLQLTQQGVIRRQRGRIMLTERGLEVADAVALELWPG